MILADPTDFVRTSSAVAEDWQDELRNAVRQPVELCRILRLPQHFEAAAVEASRQFPLFVPRGYIARMRPGDVRDPLLRQVLPLAEEFTDAAGFTRDPVGDLASKRESGIIQKYRSRVLTITTGACGVHCRYCFRRHFPYSTVPRGPDDWSAWIAEIRRDASIDEVILSGGDPLTLVDSQLARLAEMIAGVPHVRRLRIHTRMPIVIPARVTREFTGWLTGLRVTPVLVVHANHAQELSADVQQSLTSLADAGVMLLNQSVLLRGVNDDADALVELSRRLLDCRVLPYYLHQLDRVAGAAHFEVPVERGISLVEQMRGRLPGYAVPRYAREVAGEASKQVLA
ncbi:MAG: EF-P beta-lysylation protein EpmB [Pirellulaceae bacterium]|nr:EF-P beta-lysylation protein EpmB [Pirellulaceae bacterium]